MQVLLEVYGFGGLGVRVWRFRVWGTGLVV